MTIATEATGSRLAPYGALILAAWRGRENELVPLVDATLTEVVPRGEGIGVTTCHWVTALLRNGLGHYDEALAAARLVIEPPRRLDWPLNVTPAGIHRGRGPQRSPAAGPRGVRAADRRSLSPSQADWGLGIEARCRALLSEPAVAETALPGGNRAARSHPRPRRARPGAPAVRRMAAPRGPAGRRANAVAHRP